jgi:hypothetical protein
VDRASVLEDLYENELAFQKKKQRMLECYMEAYEHILDTVEQQRMAQIIVNLIAQRPIFDMNDSYFIASYQARILFHLYGR